MVENELFRSIVGSKLHRTDTPDSDTDVRGVYKLSLRNRLSPFYTEKVRHERGDQHDIVMYELSHFVRLLAKNNPTAMETVASDLMTGDSELASRLMSAALDTERYVKNTNSMIRDMKKKGTQKSLSHAQRLSYHLAHYIRTGELLFDVLKYPPIVMQSIMLTKKGLSNTPMEAWENMQPRKIHHVQNLDTLDWLVYTTYIDS